MGRLGSRPRLSRRNDGSSRPGTAPKRQEQAGPGAHCDDGRGAARGRLRPGHGLIGIRERVRLYDGEMTTGTPDGGGFLLRRDRGSREGRADGPGGDPDGHQDARA
ncbi:hypothetical protein EAS64_03915 [Trebonia kvetii]|uniref:Uncharacterized protein n=1 Tax=Trebonia kvetii TaxID=2480626 RepID=A0A6P2C597_9ACTN|nr:hypothetical protein EAS64_03915 [Trebonia kvetii]